MPPRRPRNPSTNTSSDGRDNPWELEELRAEVNALRNELLESQRPHPPSYRNSTFPATASLETAVFSPGPGRGRSSRSQRDGTPPRANLHRRAMSRDESLVSDSDYGTLSSQTVSHSTPSTPRRNHARSGAMISRGELVTVNIYGPTGFCPSAGVPHHAGAPPSGPPPPPAPTLPSGVASGSPCEAPPAATAPPQVPRPLVHHEPVPRSVRSSGVPSHLTTPLRYRTPIPLIRPPNAHTQDTWYLVTVGYGTGIFRLLGLATLLTRNTGRFKSSWHGVSGGWEAARDAYEESYIAGAVELLPCPDGIYQRAIQHSPSS